MNLKCRCGNVLSNAGSPNGVEHMLISDYSKERLQDAVDRDVRANGVIDSWWDHWKQSGALELWMCLNCKRLYVSPDASGEKMLVYSIENVQV